MRDITKRLDTLETTLQRNIPAKLTVTLADGSESVEDAESVWRFFTDEELRKQVVDVEADQIGYVELAALIVNLCRS